ncbi:unnamed protein product [Bathycoccus prasinos]
MEIYVWIDRLNLQSKPKKHFARDFSDGVLCAEILMKTTTSVSSSSSRRSNTARMISMHNYPIKNSFKGKLENWELLNAKVLRSPKIRCELTREEMSAVARSEKDAAERVLLKIKTAVEDDFMSLDHPDERDRDREEGGEEESNNEAISRLTVKVDALTAKCAKLEQLLELTKRKAIM